MPCVVALGRLNSFPRSQAFGTTVTTIDDYRPNMAELIHIKRRGEEVCFALKGFGLKLDGILRRLSNVADGNCLVTRLYRASNPTLTKSSETPSLHSSVIFFSQLQATISPYLAVD